MPRTLRSFLPGLLALFCVVVLPVPRAIADTSLSRGQIDALVAPVALYPDQLLAKVMIASTYPLEVVEAARFVKDNGSLKGGALDTALARQSWDDSVKSLARVPGVVTMMSDKIDWTQKLGDAFLAQQQDVMDSVQRLRAQAQKGGYLKSSDQQRVEVHDQTIVIEPVQPEVVYVPYYNPTVVYGAWAYPTYPPYYWPPPPGYAWGAGVAAGIGFATGVAITAAFWNNGFNWNNHNVYVNNNVNINNFNKFNNFNNRTNVINGQTWRHDADHRRGVNYANSNLRQQYGRGTLPGADARRDFRGFNNRSGAGNRDNDLAGRTNTPGSRAGSSGLDRSSLNRGGAGDRGFGGNNGSNRSNIGGGNGLSNRGGGFDGLGAGASTHQFSNRGHTAMSGGFRSGGGGVRRR
ncbi:MAG TPA: DUF3300 domain-containing protein [Rhizomicrobium sp.]|nr:DUF3300 domain-containing protein [Rhizomicrobium sp.]